MVVSHEIFEIKSHEKALFLKSVLSVKLYQIKMYLGFKNKCAKLVNGNFPTVPHWIDSYTHESIHCDTSESIQNESESVHGDANESIQYKTESILHNVD